MTWISSPPRRVLADGSPEEVFSKEEVLSEAGLELPHTAALAKKLGAEDILLSDASFLAAAFRV